MRFLYFLVICLAITTVGSAETPSTKPAIAPIKDPSLLIDNEITRLDSLIEATQQSLEAQKKLKVALLEYNQLQEMHFKDPKNNLVLLRMSKSALKALELIKEYNLSQTFDADFINELTVLSSLANKRGIPK